MLDLKLMDAKSYDEGRERTLRRLHSCFSHRESGNFRVAIRNSSPRRICSLRRQRADQPMPNVAVY
jgi:hypothetical protein